MMILIYITSLKHISCQIFKETDKIRIMGFHQLPSAILFDDPIHGRNNLISAHIHQRCVKDVEIIILKHLAQFIGEKLFKKILGDATTPFEGRG